MEDAAEKVKQGARILVVIGNPPCDRYAGVSEEEEDDFIQPYKKGLYERFGIRKQLLDDPYIRFFRLGERVIAEHSGKGIVCLISNSSWIGRESHPVMREHLAQSFSEIWIASGSGNLLCREGGQHSVVGAPCSVRCWAILQLHACLPVW